ncbi:hypothetical protein HNP93_001005 [Methanococcus maripaludis]|uniref:Uncharacterized protein n=1 Tax=Methanococcus maripaludis TaxID=39152 RepID=A0A7J9P6B8_METMI|nr:hypothetical protein [Methanococcus maripaludis]MBA2858304.1 hypothetical protein [Methanococcus maripaludis]
MVIAGFAAGAVVFHRTIFHGVSFLNYRLSKDGVAMVHHNSITSVKGFGGGNNSQKSPSHSGGPTLSLGKKTCSGDSGQRSTDKVSDRTWFSKRDSSSSENLSDSGYGPDYTKGN